MASRMEKYYKTREAKRRSVRNESLYQTIYEDETYSNIEGVVATPKANEINIEKIKELITSHEQQKNQSRKLVRKPIDIPQEIIEPEEEKNYDIRDILVKAKDSRENKDETYRNLKNTEYNILKNIKIDDVKSKEEKEEELKEIMDTITSMGLLNKMSDQELSLNMFDDLKSDTIVDDPTIIKSVLKDLKEEKLNKTGEMDNTFFSSSLGIKDKDFESLKDIKDSSDKKNKIKGNIIVSKIKIILIIVAFVILKLKKK